MGDVERIDKYRIRVNGYEVRATEQQEQAIRQMDDEATARFLKIMGADR